MPRPPCLVKELPVLGTPRRGEEPPPLALTAACKLGVDNVQRPLLTLPLASPLRGASCALTPLGRRCYRRCCCWRRCTRLGGLRLGPPLKVTWPGRHLQRLFARRKVPVLAGRRGCGRRGRGWLGGRWRRRRHANEVEGIDQHRRLHTQVKRLLRSKSRVAVDLEQPWLELRIELFGGGGKHARVEKRGHGSAE